MAVQRFGNRTIMTDETTFHLQDWSDKLFFKIATDAGGMNFATLMEIDAYGNVRITGDATEQAEVQ